MKYVYKTAWSIVTGVNLDTNTAPVELLRSEKGSFFLVKPEDALLDDLDKSIAIGHVFLKRFVGQGSSSDLQDEIVDAQKKFRAERTRKFGDHTVLLFEATGSAEITLGETRQHGDFIVALDAFSKHDIAPIYAELVDGMKLAIALEKQNIGRYELVGQSVYFVTEQGTPVYSLNFKFSAEASVASKMVDGTRESIQSRFSSVMRLKNAKSITRLFSQVCEHKRDKLKTFLSAWLAMEILVLSSFKKFETSLLQPLLSSKHSKLREKFVSRIHEVMSDKYRLSEKFIAMSIALFPDSDDRDLEQDLESFMKIKKVRDEIFHGEEFEEESLPLGELTAMFRKYVNAKLPHDAN